MSNCSTKKILILTANPRNTERLRLDEEVRQIQEGLRRSTSRETFEIVSEWAVTPRALRRAMLDHNPQIVHFSGHGAGEQGLALEDDGGNIKLVTADTLAVLFELFSDQVECVLLNACYSEVQAAAIAQHIRYVVGMNQVVGDQAAREFAVGFYDGLGAGRSYEFSYKLGCNAIAMEGIAEELTPVLKQKSDDGQTVVTVPTYIPSPLTIPDAAPAPKATSNDSLGRDPVEIFFSYSHRDEELRDELALHLSMLKRQGVIKAWHDREITAGSDWAGAIDQNMNSAQVILLLISANFLASDYCYDKEMQRAIERHQAGEARVIPIILKPVDWGGAPFSKLQALPKNAKPVTTWENRDEAFFNIAQGIRRAVEELVAPLQPVGPVRGVPIDTPKSTLTGVSAFMQPVTVPQDLGSGPQSRLDTSNYSTPAGSAENLAWIMSIPSDGGQVPLDSPLYIERPPIESDCYRSIANPGALILIKAPRQMGKTSLMSRILHHGTTQCNYRSVQILFQEADTEVFESLETFLQWFCSTVTFELNLEDKVPDYWKGVLGNKQKCTNYFQRYLLSTIDCPLVLGLDEVDRLFGHFEIAEGFFSLLRAWHERSKNEPAWQKLRLIIAHSQEVYISLDVNQSPFNVGQIVYLPEFNKSQVSDLVQRHGLQWSDNEVDQLMGIVDGHPYLVRTALYQIASGKLTLAKLLELAPTEQGPYGKHLTHHLSNLKDPQLRSALKRVVTSDHPVQLDSEQQHKLCGMGLAELQGNAVIPLCNLYRLYFRDRLRDD